jgi:hypothetical protein
MCGNNSRFDADPQAQRVFWPLLLMLQMISMMRIEMLASFQPSGFGRGVSYEQGCQANRFLLNYIIKIQGDPSTQTPLSTSESHIRMGLRHRIVTTRPPTRSCQSRNAQ